MRWVAIPLAGCLLFLFFLHRGFPYERLATGLASRIGAATGAEIRIRDLTPRVTLAGPGLEAEGVTAVTHGGARIELERAFVRPAFSLAWLRANPAVHVDLSGANLTALGTATLRVPGFHGDLHGIELALLPGVSLRGVADLDLDLEAGDAGPEGTARFAVGRGILGAPGMKMQVPFTSFAGELRFGGETLAELTSASLEGPMISARGRGTLGRAEQPMDAPLALTLDITASPGLRAPLQSLGIQVGPDGKATLQVSGTPARPQLR